MEVKINITKTRFFVLLGAILLLSAGIFVYAFGTSDPATFGHSVGEVDWSESIPDLLTVEESTTAGPGYASLDLFSRGGGTRKYSLRSTDGTGEPLSSFGIYDNSRSTYSLVIDQDEKVGIGTNDPQDVLDVNGDARISGILCMGTPLKCITDLKGFVVGGHKRDSGNSCESSWGQSVSCSCPSGSTERYTGSDYQNYQYYICAIN